MPEPSGNITYEVFTQDEATRAMGDALRKAFGAATWAGTPPPATITPFPEVPPEVEGILNPAGRDRYSFVQWFNRMKKTDPYTLFNLLVNDYAGRVYTQKYDELLKSVKGDITVDIKLQAGERAETFAKDVVTQADWFMKSGQRLEFFPLYKDIMASINTGVGKGVTTRYLSDIKQQQTAFETVLQGATSPLGWQKLNEAIAKGDVTVEEGYGPMSPYRQWQRRYLDELKTHADTEAGRINLQQAVDSGLIGENEAFRDNIYYQQYTWETSQTEGKKRAVEERNLLRDMSPAGRQALADAVAEGKITSEKAYGTTAPSVSGMGAIGGGPVTTTPTGAGVVPTQDIGGTPLVAGSVGGVTPTTGTVSNMPSYWAWLAQTGMPDNMSSRNVYDAYRSGQFVEAPGGAGFRPLSFKAWLEQTGMPETVASNTMYQEYLAANPVGSHQETAWEKWQRESPGGGLKDMSQANEMAGQARVQSAEQMKVQKAATRGRQAQFFAQQYPTEYQNWVTGQQQTRNTYGGGAGGLGAAGVPLAFYNWATAKGDLETPLTPEQTAFQQTKNERELKNWQDYGGIYEEYQDYLGKAPEYKPIEKWIEETPEVGVRVQRRRYPTSPRGVWR